MKIKGSKNNIVCEGNFIFDNAEALKEALIEKLEKLDDSKTVTFDLSHLEEVDSSGIQLLLSFFKTLEERRIQYKVTQISEELLEVLDLSGLSKFFRLEVSE
jgi:anti-anti-sigma factor